jgi:hypothetical protein
MEEKDSTDVFFKLLEYEDRYLRISKKPLNRWTKETFKETSYGRYIVNEFARLIAENENENYEVIFYSLMNKIDDKLQSKCSVQGLESKKVFLIMKNTLEHVFYYINNPIPYY